MSNAQLRFILDSLQDLSDQLTKFGHTLIVLEGDAQIQIHDLVKQLDIDCLVCAKQIGSYEHHTLNSLVDALPELTVKTFWQHTLFNHSDVSECFNTVKSFSKFRNFVEKRLFPQQPTDATSVNNVHQCVTDEMANRSKTVLGQWRSKFVSSLPNSADVEPFFAGELAAQYHLVNYLNSGAAKTYKLTRNDLEGWFNSTKLSPYLAVGNLSPRQIWHAVCLLEQQEGANDSTYWIKFELLWREYFQWLAVSIGNKLYYFQGLAKAKPLTSFFPERFQKWCGGNTPYPLVNALMKQLNSTGYMSNRGRQIVASCFVNELQLDWRYGAAYFQQQLIDFDVASNWGNWQYIAGVGVDPRGGRHFNLDKQTQMYDPNGYFIRKYQGSVVSGHLDSTDLVDWPILAESEE